jgi:tellurite resistance protein TerC
MLYLYVRWKIGADPALESHWGPADGMAARIGMEFLTGYLVEKALAVDNIFVFLVVFAFFGIPKRYQHRVLFFGILGALLFRMVFIAMGSVLMKFEAVVLLFGIFLALTGVKTLLSSEKPLDPARNPLIRLMKRFLPVTSELHGERFFVRKDGVLAATPLFVALAFLELSDVVFAVDSVPAIFAITQEPFLVFTSNILAILGLRSMFFLLSGVVGRLKYLKHGLGLVLIFVGLKMAWLNGAFGGKFPVGLSLGIIAGILGASVVASLVRFPGRGKEAPGRLREQV